MRRDTHSKFDNYDLDVNNPDARYNMAYKRVKRIKGFYVHLLVYILVNAFVLFSHFNRSRIGEEVFWEWQTWNTVFFWGIGLIAHGLSVFGKNIFFGSDWEQKKIQEFMDKNKDNKWE